MSCYSFIRRVLSRVSIIATLFLILVQAAETSKSKGEPKPKTPTTVISLAESINRSQRSLQDPERAQASREQWEQALKEIKELALGDFAGATRQDEQKRPKSNDFSRWKLLLDQPTKLELDPETNLTTTTTGAGNKTNGVNSSISNNDQKAAAKKMPRFEGFASWERLLQDWAEDVQEYMDKIYAENTEYPMSTYGRPKMESTTKSQQGSKKEARDLVGISKRLPERRRNTISLPIPAPAKNGEAVLPHTDLSDKSKNIWIVTTAALPWMTGTAVNPLLRAAYLTEGRKEAGGTVTLMLPWLERSQDQDNVYGKNRRFETPAQQEENIRTWLRDMAKLPIASEELKIEWYTAWQNRVENSLYSMGDITALIPAEQVDICILEEPEHLNWYRAPGESWSVKFKHVVGIIHTNYFVYAQDQPAAFIRAPGMRLLCSWMCRAHCHRVIKLSGTLGQFAPEKELVENVHGVRGNFLETGEEVRKRLLGGGAMSDPIFGSNAVPTVYFIGKMLWSKGLGSLMELLRYAEESAGIKVHVDMYGGGPDMDAAVARAKDLSVDMEFHGPIDHGELDMSHKIFINPSTSEVLCTTVAEALAMGKFVVLPSHPSNDFFAQFPNCLAYSNKEEFVGYLYYALTHSPEPLEKEDAYALSWKAATERLEAAGSIPVREAEAMSQALKSNGTGIEISLPPLIENDKSRERLAATIRRSRDRYRQFRSRLSQEILHSNVLPVGVKQRLVSELDKRLDLDIETILESPKVNIQLSPAELDRRLLEFYKTIASGPRGDVLRVIGGGQDVAFQDLYIKKQATRERLRNPTNATSLSFGPFDAEDTEDSSRTASQRVRLALKNNLQRAIIPIPRSKRTQVRPNGNDEDSSKMTMSLTPRTVGSGSSHMHAQLQLPTTGSKRLCPPRRMPRSCSLLI